MRYQIDVHPQLARELLTIGARVGPVRCVNGLPAVGTLTLVACHLVTAVSGDQCVRMVWADDAVEDRLAILKPQYEHDEP
jgi:hypothetical protein